MAAGIPFMEVTGRKDVQNGGSSILFITFERQNSLCLLFTTDLGYLNSSKLPFKI